MKKRIVEFIQAFSWKSIFKDDLIGFCNPFSDKNNKPLTPKLHIFKHMIGIHPKTAATALHERNE